MAQPNKAQWRVIWVVAIFLVAAWPGDADRSLALKAVSWLADPMNHLPARPADLSMELDDDADAVAAHDSQLADYDALHDSHSIFMRLRMRLKEVSEPFDPTTERQILVGLGVIGALAAWRLGARKEGA